MANTVTSYIPKVLGAGLLALRENAIFPRLVRNYSGRIGTAHVKGNAIDIPTGAALSAAAISPSNTPPANTDVSVSTTQLTLDTWQGVAFHLDDQQLTQIDAQNNFIPIEISEAMKALGNKVDSDGLALYKDIYGNAGTMGTTPFASDSTAWTNGARKKLIEQLSPVGPWNIVLNPAAEALALGLATFQKANERGSASTMITGEIGSVLGANWFVNQNVPTHTAGTLTDGSNMAALINSASVAVGDSSVAMDATSLSNAVVKGDLFTVAGDTQQYVVTAGATASGNAITISFSPNAKVAWANNAAVTFTGGSGGGTDHVPNLAFHSDAFAFAAAPIADSMVEGLGGPSAIVTDPVTGIPVRLQVTREHYQTTWRFDILYGWKTIRPEFACRILG